MSRRLFGPVREWKRESRGGMGVAGERGDVVDLLQRQHREIKRAFRAAAIPGRARGKAFHRLVRLLAVHEAAEEAHVHPKARRALPGGRLLAGARRAEEKDAKRLLRKLWRIGPYSEGYLPILRELRRAVLAHAAREEREEFRALRARVSRSRLRLLGLEVKATQAIAPTRPHRLVNNEAANKMSAPIFGPIDRGRDLARRAVLRQ